MTKLVAIINVIAWGGFWAFGFLALTADRVNENQILIAALLAAIGGGVGVYTFLRCSRFCEQTGYDKGYKRAAHSDDTAATES